MTLRHAALAAAVLGLPLAAAPAVAGTFTETFTGVAANTATPFTNSIFTFSSPSDPGAYVVGNTNGLFTSLTGKALLPSSATPTALDISFSAPVTSFSLDFALADLLGFGGSDLLDYTTSAGGSGDATATVPALTDYPEGVLDYSGAAITSIVLSSTYTLAVDDLSATTVPEPAALALLAVGIAGIAAFRFRRA